MKRILGFTLAEVLITLAIIGIVAAISIPSVISNTQQQEFKTGLRKAVSVLNSAITMNIAIEGESPYDNADLFNYLKRHMSIMKTTEGMLGFYWVQTSTGAAFNNAAFYTTDGMRFEFYDAGTSNISKLPLYENENIFVCKGATTSVRYIDGVPVNPDYDFSLCKGCGAYGLSNNSDETTQPPCLITVDVNGDRKPNPANVNCKSLDCAKPYKLSTPNGSKLTDIFSIMITDKQAIPYGTAAQRAMYQAQK